MDRPNILLILTDQQSHTMMSCAGNDWVQTPALDALAATGVRFACCSASDPVCVPSRFSFATGRYPSHIGMRSNVRPTRDPLPPELTALGLGHTIRAAGYETVYGGKQHFPGANAEDFGWDVFCPHERDQLVAASVEYLRQAPARPFFMVASFINPHDICHLAIHAFATEGQDLRLKEKCVVEGASVSAAAANPEGMDDETFFRNVCPPLPANHQPQADEPEAIAALLDQRGFRRAAREQWGEREWRRHRWAYARLTQQVDAEIGQVLQALDASGLADDTVVIFTSDHGDHDGSHQLEHKTVLYEEATRVPFIVADPRCRRPGTVEPALLCNGTDLYTTICDYAGATPPADLTGLSAKPLAQGEAVERWRDHVLIESEMGYGIRSERYLYALYDEGANREQLYDLAADPGQTRNFAHDPGLAETVAWHRQKLRQYHDVTFPEA